MTARGIAVREDLCTGCRACQVACVAGHEGLFGVYTARLRAVKDDAHIDGEQDGDRSQHQSDGGEGDDWTSAMRFPVHGQGS